MNCLCDKLLGSILVAVVVLPLYCMHSSSVTLPIEDILRDDKYLPVIQELIRGSFTQVRFDVEKALYFAASYRRNNNNIITNLIRALPEHVEDNLRLYAVHTKLLMTGRGNQAGFLSECQPELRNEKWMELLGNWSMADNNQALIRNCPIKSEALTLIGNSRQ